MQLARSLKCLLAAILCAAMIAGLTLTVGAAPGARAGGRQIAQCGEFAALDILASLGKALGKAAAKKAGSWALGSVMRAMGLGKPTTQDIMDALNKSMAEINAKLDGIQAGIVDIENAMKVYFDKSEALRNYSDLLTYTTDVQTNFDNWMHLQIEPYNGTKENPKIPPKPGEPGYDDMKKNLDRWADSITDSSSKVAMAIGQIHKDLANPSVSVLKGIVDVAIDEAGTEWLGQDFATTIRSTNGIPVVANRVMYARGELDGSFCGDEAALGKTHHFAEGYASREGDSISETFILIQNTNPRKSAHAKVSFLMPSGENRELFVKIPASSRQTVNAGDHVSGEFGIKVESDIDIAVERSCYLDGRLDGSTVNADAGLTRRKTFAEGYVVPDYFSTYFTLMNPDAARAAAVKATFFRPDGSTEETSVEVAPGSRATIDAGNHVQGEFSTTIASTNGVPVVAERVVYASEGSGDRNLCGATVSSGDSSYHEHKYFAEGYVVPGVFDTYYTLVNPGGKPAQVDFSFMKADGTTARHELALDPGRRATVSAADYLQGEFATAIESTEPIASERVTYARPVGTGTLQGANLGRGVSKAETEWNFAEGTNRKHLGARTYLTLANPGTRTARVEIAFQTPDGKVFKKQVSVPPRGAGTASSDTITGLSGNGGRVTLDAGAEVQASALDAWYSYLEDTLVGSVYQRESGANMMIEAYNYSGVDTSYWWNNFLGEEAAEVQMFLQQAYRLAMSQVDLVEQPGIPVFPDAAKNIIKRANFVADIINNKCNYNAPDDPDYQADLASQRRFLGTVILDGSIAGSTDAVSIQCSADGAPTLSGNGAYQVGYVEKFRTGASDRFQEYYDTWQGTSMTPRNDFSVYTFSIPGAVGGKTYDVVVRVNGSAYYTGKIDSVSTDPNGNAYDPQKSVAKIDTLPFVYFKRSGGLNAVENLVYQYSQLVTVKNNCCDPIRIDLDDGGYLINGAVKDSYDGTSSNGTIQRKLGLVLKPSADGYMKGAYVYPYCKSMRYLSIYLGDGRTTWNFLNSLSGNDYMSAAWKTNKRGGNWEDHWGKGCRAFYVLPSPTWDMNLELHVASNPDGPPYHGSTEVQMNVSITGLSFGFY